MTDKITWRTEPRRLGELKAFQNNPRVMDGAMDKKLDQSLAKMGYAETIVVDIDGTILAGNQRHRLLLAKYGPDHAIDVRVPSRVLTDEERRQYVLNSNRIHGEWDWSILKDQFDIGELMAAGFDADLANIFDDQLEVEDDEDWDEEAEIKKAQETDIQVGDHFLLGRHHLLCGDATDPAVLKKLLGDKRASMIYSDPVYNLSIDYNRGVGGKQSYGGAVNDKRSPAEYRTFLKQSIDAALAVAEQDAHVFYWNDESQIGLVQSLFEGAGLVNRRVCLWVKNSHNPTPGVAFNKMYEPCIYGTRGKPYLAKGVESLNEIFNKEIGMRGKIEEEIARYNKFRTGVLGAKKRDKAADIDVRTYAKYLLKEGTISEKRELLSCLKSDLVLKDRKIEMGR